jgi:cytochrome d ubiquinol oxidase subunit II
VAAFAATTVGIAVCVVSLFVDLYPRVMVSRTNPAFDLTVNNTASGSYALKAITVVAAVFLPVVLVYTAWTYYVFRKRISPADVGGPRSVPQQRQQAPDEATAPVRPPSA